MNREDEENLACACVLSKLAERIAEALTRWEKELHLEKLDGVQLMVDGLTSTHQDCKNLLRTAGFIKAQGHLNDLEKVAVTILRTLDSCVIAPWNRVRGEPQKANRLFGLWQKKNPLLPLQKTLQQLQSKLDKLRQGNRLNEARQAVARPINRKQPSFFVASSTEALPTARKLIKALKSTASGSSWKIRLWADPGTFIKGESTLETLESIFRKCDFGIYLLTADDKLVMRKKQTLTARGNVIFELGMGIAVHGRRRSFIVHEKVYRISDLDGISTTPYAKIPTGKNSKSSPPSIKEIRRIADELVIAVNEEISRVQQSGK